MNLLITFILAVSVLGYQNPETDKIISMKIKVGNFGINPPLCGVTAYIVVYRGIVQKPNTAFPNNEVLLFVTCKADRFGRTWSADSIYNFKLSEVVMDNKSAQLMNVSGIDAKDFATRKCYTVISVR